MWTPGSRCSCQHDTAIDGPGGLDMRKIHLELEKLRERKKPVVKGKGKIPKYLGQIKPKAYSLPKLVELSGSGISGGDIKSFFRNPIRYIQDAIDERKRKKLPVEIQMMLEDATDPDAPVVEDDPLAGILGDSGEDDILADLMSEPDYSGSPYALPFSAYDPSALPSAPPAEVDSAPISKAPKQKPSRRRA